MSKCIIIINKPNEERSQHKLWPRCAFNSNDQCILFTTPGINSLAACR